MSFINAGGPKEALSSLIQSLLKALVGSNLPLRRSWIANDVPPFCSLFEWRYTFFQFLSTIIVNLVHTIVQSAYLCVIFHVKHKRYHSSRFLPDFQFLVKYKMANIIGGVTGLQHCLEMYLISLRRSKVFDWRQNRFELLHHIKNSGKWFIQLPPPPHTPCTRVGVFACTSEG